MTSQKHTEQLSYLDRGLQFVEVREGGAIPIVSDATLFLGVYGFSFSEAESRRLVQMILGANPLGILVAGKDAEQIFEELLKALSVVEPPQGMMTKYSTDCMEEAVSDFLRGMWPYEERFDEWKSYVLISYGSSSEMLRAAARRIISSK